MTALIGALRVSLAADTASFEQGMARASRSAKSNASAIQSSFAGLKGAIGGFLGALSLGAVIEAGKAALDYAGSLRELAQNLGVTAKDLQEFSYAAGQAGVSQDTLQIGLQKLTVSMGKAEVGSQAQIKAFKAIGISVDELKGKTTGDVFRLIADGLGNVTDRAQRAAVEMALFGRSGSRLDTLLSGGVGTLNNLSKAAEELGIVLSDEQIQRSEETAHKLEALETVLKANIAAAVADNADSILGLANALLKLVSVIPKAIQGWSLFLQYGGAGAVALMNGQNPLAAIRGVAAQNNNAILGARFAADRAASSLGKSGVNVGRFLAPGGGGGGSSHGADHSAEDLQRKQLDALQKAFDFTQDQLRADEDILNAKKDLSDDYVEQTTLQIQILNNQREQYKAQLDYQVQQNKITKGADGISQAQADILLAKYDEADQTKRQKVLAEEQTHRLEDIKMLTEQDFERKKEILEKQADLATTQAERRQIELELLRLAYEEKAQALQRIIDTSKDSAEIENARRDLVNLKANYALDRQAVMKDTAGPLEQWKEQVPKTAAEINEALQSIETKGLDSLTDAISGVISGTEKLKDAFHSVALSILNDLIQMTIKMLIFRAISAIGGAIAGGAGGMSVDTGATGAAASLPGIGDAASSLPTLSFAGGGGFDILGRTGTDRNVMSINGLPIANVSYGERVSISNDNEMGGGRGGVALTMHNDFRGADPSAVAAIKTHLNKLEQELPSRIVSTMSDARSRFVWRGK